MSKFIVVLLTLSVVCQNNNKELINKKIIIPENWELIYESDSQSNIDNLKDHISIIVYINGNCYGCIQDLKRWMKYIEENSFSKKINFVFFTDIFDIDTFIAIVRSTTTFEYSIYNDKA
ncbi:MAG TPA: hypothetical protein VK982_15715, partial [Bacteroidales bacterium]|nr:hypothetical protein [Bacteroidales bacterium]